MNKLELIIYLQQLLDSCPDLDELRLRLIRDELEEITIMNIRDETEKDIRDHELNTEYKSNYQRKQERDAKLKALLEIICLLYIIG